MILENDNASTRKRPRRRSQRCRFGDRLQPVGISVADEIQLDAVLKPGLRPGHENRESANGIERLGDDGVAVPGEAEILDLDLGDVGQLPEGPFDRGRRLAF